MGDDDKRNILNSILDVPRTPSVILEMLQLPITSGYRKIHWLIDNGLLNVHGYTITHNGIRVNKYKPIFENLEIKIEKGKVLARVCLSREDTNMHL